MTRLQGNEQVVKPHFILVLDGFSHRMIDQVPELESILRDAVKLGVTVVCLVDDQSSEPARLQTRITLSSTGELKFAQTFFGGRHEEEITADSCSIQLSELNSAYSSAVKPCRQR